jgi:RNA polymerase sigma factor (sigma-70 family)
MARCTQGSIEPSNAGALRSGGRGALNGLGTLPGRSRLFDVTSYEPVLSSAAETDAISADASMVTDLHEAHGAALYDFARHLGLSDDQAADALQEAILRLWRELRRGTLIERPPAWLYRAIYRLAMDQHRWRRRLSLLLPRLAPLRMDSVGPEGSDRLTVWQAVAELPPRQRHVLYLHYAADLTFDQIAGVIGISASATRTHASRGLAALRQRLSIGKDS